MLGFLSPLGLPLRTVGKVPKFPMAMELSQMLVQSEQLQPSCAAPGSVAQMQGCLTGIHKTVSIISLASPSIFIFTLPASPVLLFNRLYPLQRKKIKTQSLLYHFPTGTAFAHFVPAFLR